MFASDYCLRAAGQRAEYGWRSSPGRALRLFCGKPLQEVQEITFEIGMLGKYWLDSNDCRSSPVLRSLPGWAFSAL